MPFKWSRVSIHRTVVADSPMSMNRNNIMKKAEPTSHGKDFPRLSPINAIHAIDGVVTGVNYYIRGNGCLSARKWEVGGGSERLERSVPKRQTQILYRSFQPDRIWDGLELH